MTPLGKTGSSSNSPVIGLFGGVILNVIMSGLTGNLIAGGSGLGTLNVMTSGLGGVAAGDAIDSLSALA